MMRGIRGSRPSPALVVAILALVAALAGQALAEQATLAKLTKQEKKQVNKLIDKAEPGLNVNSAKSADTATNAPAMRVVWIAADARSDVTGED